MSPVPALKVCVLERREVLGGACVTEELWPGFKVSTAAYVNSLLRPEIIRDLELKRHGFEMLPQKPLVVHPVPRWPLAPARSGQGDDASGDRQVLARRTPRLCRSYEAMLERVADFLEPTLVKTPPNPWSLRPGNLLQLAKLGLSFAKLGNDGQKAVEILTGAATPILDRWFESEQLKVTLATDAIIGAMASPSMPGTAYVLFHHVMGECDGVRGVWGYVRGGMGGISNAIAAAARERGAEIRTNAEVARILVKNGAVRGVALEDGTEFRARRVASGADANVTFLRLMDSGDLPADFVEAVRNIDYASASCKINLALSELPDFTAVPGTRRARSTAARSTSRPRWSTSSGRTTTPSTGCPSEQPIIEATIPSVLDDTLAPKGKHVMSMFTQYFPYKLAPGSVPQEEKEKYADRCFDLMNEYAPNFTRSVIARQVLSPVDLEQRFGLTGGNIMQGAMSLSSLSFMRPVPGYADYRTPIRGLYLCGAATHPGGGVMGACGYNAAREIQRDVRAGMSSEPDSARTMSELPPDCRRCARQAPRPRG